MTAIELRPVTQDIVVDEVLPHAPETIWKALTSSALIARWIMEPSGFAPVEGTSFTFRTTPAGAWDGTIHCRVLEVIPNERLAYSWKSGDDGNAGDQGYARQHLPGIQRAHGTVQADFARP